MLHYGRLVDAEHAVYHARLRPLLEEAALVPHGAPELVDGRYLLLLEVVVAAELHEGLIKHLARHPARLLTLHARVVAQRVGSYPREYGLRLQERLEELPPRPFSRRETVLPFPQLKGAAEYPVEHAGELVAYNLGRELRVLPVLGYRHVEGHVLQPAYEAERGVLRERQLVEVEYEVGYGVGLEHVPAELPHGHRLPADEALEHSRVLPSELARVAVRGPVEYGVAYGVPSPHALVTLRREVAVVHLAHPVLPEYLARHVDHDALSVGARTDKEQAKLYLRRLPSLVHVVRRSPLHETQAEEHLQDKTRRAVGKHLVYEVVPPRALGLGVELVRVVVRHVVLRREGHDLRLCDTAAEIHHPVGERHDVEVRDERVAEPYGLHEHVRHERLPREHRRYGKVLEQLHVRHLYYVRLRDLVHLAVEHVVVAPVPLDGTVHGQHAHALAEVRGEYAVLPRA